MQTKDNRGVEEADSAKTGKTSIMLPKIKFQSDFVSLLFVLIFAIGIIVFVISLLLPVLSIPCIIFALLAIYFIVSKQKDIWFYDEYFIVKNSITGKIKQNNIAYSAIKEVSYHYSTYRGGSGISIFYTINGRTYTSSYDCPLPKKELTFLKTKEVSIKITPVEFESKFFEK